MPSLVLRVRALVAVLAALVMSAVLVAAPATAALSTSPARAGDFPDPYIVRSGSTYYAYSTQVMYVNVPVVTSSNLKSWSRIAEALPKLPTWAGWGHTWAPAVWKVGTRWVMYYTVRHAASDRQCISRATSSSPQGPFTDSSTAPFICQLERGGSIDASPVRDASGALHLVWKSDDNAFGQPTAIWSQRLSADGLTLTGSATRLLDADRTWQGGIIEGPAMHADGTGWYLFYGANRWDSSEAGIGYATCTGPAGPCTNRSTEKALLGRRPGADGPAGPEVFVDKYGRRQLSYHGWTGGVGYHVSGAARALFLDRLTFTSRVPTVG